MDFEYRIFKFVPQVDRFVNEQMKFKLQECSYNKASTFEIDDDYADDYDFGLYQGDRSKARKQQVFLQQHHLSMFHLQVQQLVFHLAKLKQKSTG